MKRHLRLLLPNGILLVAILLLSILVQNSASAVYLFSEFSFFPLQFVRGWLFNRMPFSFGDVLYFAGGLWGLVSIVRLLKNLRKGGAKQHILFLFFIKSTRTILCIYLLFFLGFAGSYYKKPLAKSWDMEKWLSFDQDSTGIFEFDSLLVERLNSLAPQYKYMGLKEINEAAIQNYKALTDCKLTTTGISVKPMLYGAIMERLAIDGYFNPFTGEGQINDRIPAFMHPFVLSHEMAHQTGIAAEGDANLMAYAVTTACTNPTFQYSGYLNVYLYVHFRAFYEDSAKARAIESRLNSLTKAHIDTLKQRSALSDNPAERMSSGAYNAYLKMHRQKKGIRSYGSVSENAWLLEQKRASTGAIVYKIPTE